MKIINICNDEVKIIDDKETQYYKLESINTNEGLKDINCIEGYVLKGLTILIEN